MREPPGARDPVTSVRGAVDPSTATARTHFTARPRQAGGGGRGQVCLCSSRKGWVHGASLLGGAFRLTPDANKQETPSPSYFGNWAFPSATGVASGQEADQPLAPRPRGPAPAAAPPPRAALPLPRPRPPAGHAQWAGSGWQVCVAIRSCRRRLSPPTPRPVVAARSCEVTCGSGSQGAGGRAAEGSVLPSVERVGPCRWQGCGRARPAGSPGRGWRGADFCPS